MSPRGCFLLTLVLLTGVGNPAGGAEPPSDSESVQSGIISHETTVTTRKPQRVTPILLPSNSRTPHRTDASVTPSSPGSGVRIWSLPHTPVAADEGPERVARQPDTPSAKLPEPKTRAMPADVVPSDTVADESVYALSPHARFLALPHMVSPAYARRLHETPSPPEWSGIIEEASRIFGLDKALIAAVIRVESNFSAQAQSPKGAQGAMQIMPATQIDLGLIDPFDPRANVFAGAQYLRAQLDSFGRLDLALAAYNAGPGSVRQHGGIPPFMETQKFVARVMSLCGETGAGPSP